MTQITLGEGLAAKPHGSVLTATEARQLVEPLLITEAALHEATVDQAGRYRRLVHLLGVLGSGTLGRPGAFAEVAAALADIRVAQHYLDELAAEAGLEYVRLSNAVRELT